MIDDKDIMLDDNSDLSIAGGDFVVDYSTSQEAKLITMSELGDWKNEPLIGVGIVKWLKKTITAAMVGALNKAIRLQYEYDNKQVNDIQFITDSNSKLLDMIIDCE